VLHPAGGAGDYAARRPLAMTAGPRRAYLPAAGHAWALPLYDPLVKLLGGEAARRALVEQAALRPGDRVLDLGCGTGGLALLIKRLHPDVEVVGLDPDPRALARAHRKAARAGLAIQLDQGFGDALPYPDGAFDRLLSAFVLHHLPANQKEPTLREARRVLKPGATLHLLDFGGPEASAGGWLSRMLHASHRLRDNYGDRIPALVRQAGLVDARMVSHRGMLFGHIAYYRAAVGQAP
jgi:ubiquinone/menaquinone biosynthesis C-methylase UbiE